MKIKKRRIGTITTVTVIITMGLLMCTGPDSGPDYLNPGLSFEERAEDLVSRLTLEEKAAQMSNDAPAIERLGVPAFNYQGEALHGIAEAAGGKYMPATSFPQSIAMGSTWNPSLMQRVAGAISDEGRAFYNMGEMDISFWSPNINMLRDPRWGRNDEAYSEDPFLMSRIAVAFVKGLQGEHPVYLKSIASPKHFVANNSEFNRHDGSSEVTERWLREYYFPSFKACFQEGGAFATMCAYNRVNGVPACGNDWLLNTVLRDEWGFRGYVVSDCGAIGDIFENHKYTSTAEEATALAVQSGCDLNCGYVYEEALLEAVRKGLLTEEDLERSVKRLFLARYKLGMFAAPDEVPYDALGEEVVESEAHRELALEAALESIILLKNDNGTLPIPVDVKKLAVMGPNADNPVLGAYSGKPTRKISVLQGIREQLGDQVEILYERGCNITTPDKINFDPDEVVGFKGPEAELEELIMIREEYLKETSETDEALIKRAEIVAAEVDQVILVMGTNRFISNEESDAESLEWPGNQGELIRRVHAVNQNVVLVMVNGFQILLNWEKEHIPAIVEAWYAGQEQGIAVARVLSGDYNPGGKLPVTYYRSESDLPPIEDYDITKGRTYWFCEKEVLWPFGYGLSYTTFEFGNLTLDRTSVTAEEPSLKVTFEIRNTGEIEGDEVAQLYIRDLESGEKQALKKLRAFERITLEPGESRTVTFSLDPGDFSYWDEERGVWHVEPGEFEIQVGNSSESIQLKQVVAVN
jgi:beta-glucosidase